MWGRKITARIYQWNLKVLATEIYKISRGICPRFKSDLVEEFDPTHMFDVNYHPKTRYCVGLDEDGNVKCFN